VLYRAVSLRLRLRDDIAPTTQRHTNPLATALVLWEQRLRVANRSDSCPNLHDVITWHIVPCFIACGAATTSRPHS